LLKIQGIWALSSPPDPLAYTSFASWLRRCYYYYIYIEHWEILFRHVEQGWTSLYVFISGGIFRSSLNIILKNVIELKLFTLHDSSYYKINFMTE